MKCGRDASRKSTSWWQGSAGEAAPYASVPDAAVSVHTEQMRCLPKCAKCANAQNSKHEGSMQMPECRYGAVCVVGGGSKGQ